MRGCMIWRRRRSSAPLPRSPWRLSVVKNALTSEQLELFGLGYGSDVARTVAAADPASFAGRVPSSWLEIVARPEAAAVRALWEPAAAQLPRFVDYPARSISGAAAFEAHGFP